MVEKYFDINYPSYSIKAKIYCKDIHHFNKVVVSYHGFGGHKENRATARFAEHLIAKYKNFAVIIFDLPCHGEDVRKKLTLDDCDAYITMVNDYIKNRYKVEEIYAYGTSFGGYLLLKYIDAHSNPFRKIVLRCPAIEIYYSLTSRIMEDGDFEKLAKGKEVEVGFDRKIKIVQSFLDELKEYDLMKLDFIDYADDLFIIQGDKDEIVSPEIVNEFSENNVIDLLMVEGADHRFKDPNKMDYAISEAIKFIVK